MSPLAEATAKQTFSTKPPLPLESPGGTPSVLADQRRLAGAFLIKIDHIRPDPQQPRKIFDPQKQKELVESVRRLGILQPISVRFIPGEQVYFIIAGERRYQAAHAAGLTELPCWVQRPEEKAVLIHQIVENWQRADLHPFDLADALTQLRDTNGYTQKELAEATGKPESEISRLLSLLRLAPNVQKEARGDLTGEITRRHLIAIASANPATQQQVFQIVKEKGLTALQTEKLVQEEKQRVVALDRRGAHTAERFRFKTTKAMVIVQFRRGKVTKADILAALHEAREQAEREDA
jgi:ParB family transcriptional regulator, chromosome partitioning protein